MEKNEGEIKDVYWNGRVVQLCYSDLFNPRIKSPIKGTIKVTSSSSYQVNQSDPHYLEICEQMKEITEAYLIKDALEGVSELNQSDNKFNLVGIRDVREDTGFSSSLGGKLEVEVILEGTAIYN
jgi:hypothetical protein